MSSKTLETVVLYVLAAAVAVALATTLPKICANITEALTHTQQQPLRKVRL